MRLVLASHNAAKRAELQALLDGVATELMAPAALGITEPDEPHPTFIENALAKARHAAAASGMAAMADDSGVCVDALGGEPGVVSALYAALPALKLASTSTALSASASASALQSASISESEPAFPSGPHAAPVSSPREVQRRLQDTANNALLLHRLQGVADRQAHYVCTLVAVRHAADPQPLVAVGRWSGVIANQAQGSGGFGYDPLMWLAEFGCTVAELGADVKNVVGHRARAAAELRLQMQQVWRS